MMNSSYKKKNELKEATRREKESTKLVSDRFPGVAGIVIKIRYKSRGADSMMRTLNFYPESHAFFKMSCLGEGCEGGGLNLTRAVSTVIRNQQKSAKGDVRCINNDPDAEHADMSYNISVEYT